MLGLPPDVFVLSEITTHSSVPCGHCSNSSTLPVFNAHSGIPLSFTKTYSLALHDKSSGFVFTVFGTHTVSSPTTCSVSSTAHSVGAQYGVGVGVGVDASLLTICKLFISKSAPVKSTGTFFL